MGRPAIDLLLRGFFEYCLQDLRRNPWLLMDIWGAAANDPLTRVENGYSEPRNAIDWFKNQNISVFLWGRVDMPKFPCISIALSSSSEDIPETTLGDIDHFTEDVLPSEADITLDKIYKDFTPVAYDSATGLITMPKGLSTFQLAPGLHMVVEKSTGRSFVVQTLESETQFTIPPGSILDLKDIFIIPVTATWRKRMGRTRFRDSYEIGCHSASEPIQCIWLSQLVEYCLLKYKLQLLNNRNIILSTFSSSNISKNEAYLGDKVFSRFFNMSAQTEMTWIESISPLYDKVVGGILIADATRTPDNLWDSLKNMGWEPEGDEGRD